jgi:hypothetical protein
MMRPSNRFQECQMGSWCWRTITFEDQRHFDTEPPDLNLSSAIIIGGHETR